MMWLGGMRERCFPWDRAGYGALIPAAVRRTHVPVGFGLHPHLGVGRTSMWEWFPSYCDNLTLLFASRGHRLPRAMCSWDAEEAKMMGRG